jgi:hypothetical protein
MQGFVKIVNVFEVTGSFQFVFANDKFEVKFDAQMKLDPIGQVNADGILQIDSRGVVGALQLGGQFELGPVKIFGAMQLEINTTGDGRIIERVQYDFKTKTVSPGKTQVLLPAETQRIFVGGIMQIPGFELEGSFLFVNDPNEIRVSVDATFKAFDALFLSINGTVAIIKGNNAGLVINIGANLKSGFFGVDGIFDLNASFQMKVNTRTGDGSDSYDYGVMRGYTRIAFDGSLKLLSSIDLQVGGYIEAYLGVFRAEISGNATILGQSIYGYGSSAPRVNSNSHSADPFRSDRRDLASPVPPISKSAASMETEQRLSVMATTMSTSTDRYRDLCSSSESHWWEHPYSSDLKAPQAASTSRQRSKSSSGKSAQPSISST